MSCHYEPYCEHYISTQLNVSNSREAKKSKSVLLIINVQNDFLPERSNSELMIGSINELIDKNTFDMYVYCCDAHRANDTSLASNHLDAKPYDVIVLNDRETILWPDHCVIDTHGINFPDMLNTPFKGKLNPDTINSVNKSKFYPCIHCDDLQETIKSKQSKKSYILVQGFDIEPFSVFKNAEMKETGLAQFLLNEGVTDVYLCGSSRDGCVWWGAGDASSYVDQNNNKLFNVYFVIDATIPVNSSSALPDYDSENCAHAPHQKIVWQLGKVAVYNDLYKNTTDNNWVRGFLNPYGIKAISWIDAINKTEHNNEMRQGGSTNSSTKRTNSSTKRSVEKKYIIDPDFSNFLIKASKYKTKHIY